MRDCKYDDLGWCFAPHEETNDMAGSCCGSTGCKVYEDLHGKSTVDVVEHDPLRLFYDDFKEDEFDPDELTTQDILSVVINLCEDIRCLKEDLQNAN